MTTWDDLNARSRGLWTRLLGRRVLERLAQAPDLAALTDELHGLGLPLPDKGPVYPADLELAARRRAALSLEILARWAAHRRDMLAIIFEDEERRSIIALLRGAVAHAPPELRLSTLLPTPHLPERALEELARQPTTAAVAALLQAWDHPLAGALLPAAGEAEPDLLHLEVLVHRAWAERSLKAMRRFTRTGPLLRYIRQTIDLENCLTVLTLADEKDARVAEFWLDGGSALELDEAQKAVATGTAPAAGRLLASAFGTSPIAAVLRDPEQHERGIEAGLLRARLTELKQRARQNPLSPACFLSFALSLRAELLDLCRIIWGRSLGAPSTVLTATMASVP
ncbi:MAG: V-type ATPase subunit [Gemmatimonadales bacterium]